MTFCAQPQTCTCFSNIVIPFCVHTTHLQSIHTFDPIWFPHWPACKWIISLIFLSFPSLCSFLFSLLLLLSIWTRPIDSLETLALLVLSLAQDQIHNRISWLWKLLANTNKYWIKWTINEMTIGWSYWNKNYEINNVSVSTLTNKLNAQMCLIN